MKKLLALAAAFVLALTVTLPAAADVIIPPEGAFYNSHSGQCVYVGRSYIANGKEGHVAVYSAPGALMPGYMTNGERVYISHSWIDRQDSAKTEWGVTQDGRWMQMSELALIYDWQAFEDDFGSEFKEYDGTGGEITKACLYSYPGGVYVWTWDMGQDFTEAFTHIYVDADGRSWGFIGYYMGRHYQWVCLDDPLNENLGSAEYLSVEQVRSGHELVAPAEKLPVSPALWLIPAALVIVVVIVTAIIVRKRRK